jgi:signal transduction histidine kinase
MGFAVVITIMIVVSNLVLGVFTLYKNPKSASHSLLFALTIIISLWSVANFFSLYSTTPEESLQWVRIVMFVTSFLYPVLFLLSYSFPKNKIGVSRGVVLAIFSYAVLCSILSLTPYVFKEILFEENNKAPVPGPAIFVYGLNLVGFCTLSIIALISKYRSSSGLFKLQLRYVLIGVAITASLIILIFLIINIFQFSGVVLFGPATTLSIVTFFAYSIVRHRLMDIRLAVARGVAYSIITLTIVALYAVFVFIFGLRILGVEISIQAFSLIVVLGLFVGFTSKWLTSVVQKFSDKIFFQEIYSPEEFLGKCSYLLSTHLELNEITTQMRRLIREVLHLEFAEFILRPESISEYKSVVNKSLVVFDELEESRLKSFMREKDLAAIVAIQEKKDLVGYLAVGAKKSGALLSRQDVSVLQALGSQLGIAINNALRYEKIQKFSEELKDRVEVATAKLKVVNKDLKETDEKKNEFINMAAHELRAPLTAIKGFLSMVLAGDAGKLTDQARSYLEDTAVSAERMIRLVNNMLNVSRIEEGRLIYAAENTNLSKVADSAFTEFKVEAEHKGLKYEFLNEAEKDLVYVDGDKLHEVVVNFISNAIKYTETGGITIKVYNPQEGSVRLEVMDSGMGISDEEQEKLFRKFYRVESKVGKTIGTGLGLYISKLLIEKFGGKIGVTSTPGQGSIFWFELPLASD